ncbi:hypothetical protein MTO96_043609, partial [Rhipicephalus appendiculatus]
RCSPGPRFDNVTPSGSTLGNKIASSYSTSQEPPDSLNFQIESLVRLYSAHHNPTMGFAALLLALDFYIGWQLVGDLVPEIALLEKLGFRTSGVAPGTVASWLMSLHKGVVPRRGWFATLQRWGKQGGVPYSIKAAFKNALLFLFVVYGP